MKFLRLSLMVAVVATVLSLTATTSRAQGRQNRGNFDPAQFRERMMERYRDALDVKDDAEWKIISERIEKVMEARRAVGFGGGMAAFRGRRGGGDNGNDQGGNGGRRGRGFFGEPSPEAEALQKAVDSKAPADEIKAKLAKYRDSRKEKREKLEQTQEDLKKVLTARQEAAAVLVGLLD